MSLGFSDIEELLHGVIINGLINSREAFTNSPSLVVSEILHQTNSKAAFPVSLCLPILLLLFQLRTTNT